MARFNVRFPRLLTLLAGAALVGLLVFVLAPTPSQPLATRPEDAAPVALPKKYTTSTSSTTTTTTTTPTAPPQQPKDQVQQHQHQQKTSSSADAALPFLDGLLYDGSAYAEEVGGCAPPLVPPADVLQLCVADAALQAVHARAMPASVADLARHTRVITMRRNAERVAHVLGALNSTLPGLTVSWAVDGSNVSQQHLDAWVANGILSSPPCVLNSWFLFDTSITQTKPTRQGTRRRFWARLRCARPRVRCRTCASGMISRWTVTTARGG